MIVLLYAEDRTIVWTKRLNVTDSQPVIIAAHLHCAGKMET